MSALAASHRAAISQALRGRPGRPLTREQAEALHAARRVAWDPDMRQAVACGLAEGEPRTRIADRVGVDVGTLRRFLQRDEEVGCLVNAAI